MFASIFKLALVYLVQLRLLRLSQGLRQLSLAMHDPFDDVSMVVRAIVEQDGAFAVRPVIFEVTLDQTTENIGVNLTVKVFLSLVKSVPWPCLTFRFHSPLYHSPVRA